MTRLDEDAEFVSTFLVVLAIGATGLYCASYQMPMRAIVALVVMVYFYGWRTTGGER